MDTVLQAITDPSRRSMMELLADGERTVSQLLEHFTFSQPALSRHLRVLREAGLVAARTNGRQRIYSLRGEGLRSVAEWVRHYERFWNDKLDALGDVLDSSSLESGGAR